MLLSLLGLCSVKTPRQESGTRPDSAPAGSFLKQKPWRFAAAVAVLLFGFTACHSDAPDPPR
jgi:hypothetical protein